MDSQSTLADEFEDDNDEEAQSRMQQLLDEHENSLSVASTQEYETVTSQNADYAYTHEPQMIYHDTNAESTSKIHQALALNRQLKEFLMQQLTTIENAQIRNMELQREIRQKMVQHRAINPRSAIGVKKQSASDQKKTAAEHFFVSKEGKTPDDNPEATKRKERLKRVPQVTSHRKWTAKELSLLQSKVKTLTQHAIVTTLMIKSSSNKNPGSGVDLLNEVTRAGELTTAELESTLDRVNWATIAKDFVNRTPYELEKKYKNELLSGIDNSKWTREEEKEVLRLAKENRGYNWVEIAAKVGSGRRPAYSVLRKYQRGLNVSMIRSKWTEAEDKILIASVEYYGQRNWQQNAQALQGRAGQQCLHRYTKTLDPSIKKGRWSVEEDKRLMMAVHAYGLVLGSHPWVAIKEHIPGRTDVQCRERWCNILNPELNSGPWTEEEDQKLIQAIKLHGIGKWSLISEICKPRTDNQCWRRWKTLNSEEVYEYKKKIQKRDLGMVKNFVGREKERPTIEVDDVEVEIDDDDEEPFVPPVSRNKKEKKRGPKGRRKYKPEQDAMITQSQISPIYAQEMVRQNQMKFLMDNKPMLVGVPHSPFITTSLDKLKHMASYTPAPSNVDNQNKDEVFAFTEPLPLIQPNLVHFPSVKPTKVTLAALANLQKMLHENEEHQPPTIAVSEFKHMDPATVQSPEFRVLASVFNGLFQHSLHRVMSNSAQVQPHTLRKIPNIALLNKYFYQQRTGRVGPTTPVVPSPPVPIASSGTRVPQQVSQNAIMQMYQMQNLPGTEVRQPPQSTITLNSLNNAQNKNTEVETPKKKRGRPKKSTDAEPTEKTTPKRKRKPSAKKKAATEGDEEEQIVEEASEEEAPKRKSRRTKKSKETEA